MRPEVSVGKVERRSLGLGDPPGRGPASGGAFVSRLGLKIPTSSFCPHTPRSLSPPQPSPITAQKSSDIWLFNKGKCGSVCCGWSHSLWVIFM